jgi:pimeloyl-ACP methyl ester carboxylesterase
VDPAPSMRLSPPRELADPDSRFAQLAGIDVHHKVAGDPGDPTVLLFHHFHGNVATWRHVMDGLADDHQVVAFDRPGFGLSERPVPNGRGPEDPYARATSVRIALELLTTSTPPTPCWSARARAGRSHWRPTRLRRSGSVRSCC